MYNFTQICPTNILFTSRVWGVPCCICFSNMTVSSAYIKKNSKDIWSEEEVTEGPHYDDLADPRPQPE